MSHGLTRSERLREMERLYVDRAFSDIEMAERLSVDRSTVYRDRLLLESEMPFYQDAAGRWRIDRSQYLSSIRVNIFEALTLYLALKRSARQTRIANPHVANAIEKISHILQSRMGERLYHSATELLNQQADPRRIEVLETITRAWVESRKVKIAYQSLQKQAQKHYLVDVYLVEPSIWNEGAYVIGYCDVHNDVTTFKIDRIADAKLTNEYYEIPLTFDEQQILRYSWGIWTSDEEPVEVVLRFRAGEAVRRLNESIWHPTQQVEDLPDGGAIWRAQVAEWRELLPWVRGWGSACEVLSPDELRNSIKAEIQMLVDIYSDANG